MAKLTVEEAKEFSVLPQDTILHLKVDELNEKEVDGRHGKWTKLEFKFKILGIQALGDGGDPAEYEDLIAGPIWGSVPLKLTSSPENKLRQWAEAIYGMELGIGFELDTDTFLGREVRGITSTYDKRSTDAQGNPFKGHQIDSLLARADNFAQQTQQQYAQPQQQAWQQPPARPPAQQDPWGAPQGAQQQSWEDPPF